MIEVSPAICLPMRSPFQQNFPMLLFMRPAIAVCPAAAARFAASWLCFWYVLFILRWRQGAQVPGSQRTCPLSTQAKRVCSRL